jgi:hypothetical protein
MSLLYFVIMPFYSLHNMNAYYVYIFSLSAVMAKANCYVVYRGHVPGVYEEWEDCQQQVINFSGNNYNGYKIRELAVAKWRRHLWKKNQMKIIMVFSVLTAAAVVLYSVIV